MISLQHPTSAVGAPRQRRGKVIRWARAPIGAAILFSIVTCSPPPARNLVLISLDTVRRDHLSPYGYPRPTTPTLDALARESVVFLEAFAQDTNTAPSHGSLFTGLYPHLHGATANGIKLDPGVLTVAEILRERGFRTAAFVSGFTMRAEVSGLEKGFEVYDDGFEGLRRDGRETASRALSWLAERRADERFFLLLHLFDAHGPYAPRDSYAALFRSADPGPELDNISRLHRLTDRHGRWLRHLNPYVDRYDAQIRYQDDLIAELLETLDLSSTAVVVFSDHGESLGERYHAIDHGAQVFDEQTRIPMIVRAPDLEARRVPATIETVDLLPTLLELLAVEEPAALAIPGVSLLPLARGGAGGRSAVFSSARAVEARHRDRGYRLDPERRILSIRTRRWKLIRYPGLETDLFELYDLESDPGERRDLADARPDLVAALTERLEAWYRGADPSAASPDELSPEVREKLEALGYLGD